MNVAKRQNPHKSSSVRIMYIMLNCVFIHRAVHSESFQWVLPAIVSPPPACAEARFLITPESRFIAGSRCERAMLAIKPYAVILRFALRVRFNEFFAADVTSRGISHAGSDTVRKPLSSTECQSRARGSSISVSFQANDGNSSCWRFC